LFFVCSSYPARHVLAIKPGGRGNITATHIAWRTMEGAPYVPSPIVEGDYLLTAANSGPVYCYEAATGTAILALVILLPRWGIARLIMGGSELSVAGRVRDW
jgi:hypothetical protein